MVHRDRVGCREWLVVVSMLQMTLLLSSLRVVVVNVCGWWCSVVLLVVVWCRRYRWFLGDGVIRVVGERAFFAHERQRALLGEHGRSVFVGEARKRAPDGRHKRKCI